MDHRDLTEIHQVYDTDLEFANAAARIGYTASADEIGRIAWQTDTNSLWFLADNSPLTWTKLSEVSSGEIFLSGAGGWPSTTDGCANNVKNEYVTNDIDLYSLDFNQAAIEYAQWTIWMPDSWDGGTVLFKAVWTAASGTLTNTVEWNLQGRSYANDDPIDAAWGASVEVSDALIALDDIHYSALSTAITLAGAPATGELVQFRAWRDAVNDTLDADARLIGFKVYYTKV